MIVWKAFGVACVVRVNAKFPALLIKPVQPPVGRKPQQAGAVLANLLDHRHRKVGEGLRLRIEAVQRPARSRSTMRRRDP